MPLTPPHLTNHQLRCDAQFHHSLSRRLRRQARLGNQHPGAASPGWGRLNEQRRPAAIRTAGHPTHADVYADDGKGRARLVSQCVRVRAVPANPELSTSTMYHSQCLSITRRYVAVGEVGAVTMARPSHSGVDGGVGNHGDDAEEEEATEGTGSFGFRGSHAALLSRSGGAGASRAKSSNAAAAAAAASSTTGAQRATAAAATNAVGGDASVPSAEKGVTGTSSGSTAASPSYGVTKAQPIVYVYNARTLAKRRMLALPVGVQWPPQQSVAEVGSSACAQTGAASSDRGSGGASSTITLAPQISGAGSKGRGATAVADTAVSFGTAHDEDAAGVGPASATLSGTMAGGASDDPSSPPQWTDIVGMSFSHDDGLLAVLYSRAAQSRHQQQAAMSSAVGVCQAGPRPSSGGVGDMASSTSSTTSRGSRHGSFSGGGGGGSGASLLLNRSGSKLFVGEPAAVAVCGGGGEGEGRCEYALAVFAVDTGKLTALSYVDTLPAATAAVETVVGVGGGGAGGVRASAAMVDGAAPSSVSSSVLGTSSVEGVLSGGVLSGGSAGGAVATEGGNVVAPPTSTPKAPSYLETREGEGGDPPSAEEIGGAPSNSIRVFSGGASRAEEAGGGGAASPSTPLATIGAPITPPPEVVGAETGTMGGSVADAELSTPTAPSANSTASLLPEATTAASLPTTPKSAAAAAAVGGVNVAGSTGAVASGRFGTLGRLSSTKSLKGGSLFGAPSSSATSLLMSSSSVGGGGGSRNGGMGMAGHTPPPKFMPVLTGISFSCEPAGNNVSILTGGDSSTDTSPPTFSGAAGGSGSGGSGVASHVIAVHGRGFLSFYTLSTQTATTPNQVSATSTSAPSLPVVVGGQGIRSVRGGDTAVAVVKSEEVKALDSNSTVPPVVVGGTEGERGSADAVTSTTDGEAATSSSVAAAAEQAAPTAPVTSVAMTDVTPLTSALASEEVVAAPPSSPSPLTAVTSAVGTPYSAGLRVTSASHPLKLTPSPTCPVFAARLARYGPTSPMCAHTAVAWLRGATVAIPASRGANSDIVCTSGGEVVGVGAMHSTVSRGVGAENSPMPSNMISINGSASPPPTIKASSEGSGVSQAAEAPAARSSHFGAACLVVGTARGELLFFEGGRLVEVRENTRQPRPRSIRL